MIREYVHGRRARYVAPLPLFLFMMAALFLVFSMTGPLVETGDAPRHAAAAATPASASGSAPNARSNDAHWLTIVMKGTRHIGAAELHRNWRTTCPGSRGPGSSTGSCTWRTTANWRSTRSGAARPSTRSCWCRLTLPLLWLLFIRRRDVHLFDHVVFSFYSLSAMAMLLIVLSLLDAIGLDLVGEGLKVLLPPVMFYMQLRGAYQLTVVGALWRTGVLLLYALAAMAAYLVFVIVVSM